MAAFTGTLNSTIPFSLTLPTSATVVNGQVVASLVNAGATGSYTTLAASTSLTLTGASVIGLDTALTFSIASLASAGTYWVVSPWSGTIVKVYAIVDGARTTGSAILTGNIGVAPITGGVVTLTVGGAAGDIFSATPSAANTVVAGTSAINFVRSGTNDAVVRCTVTVVIRRSA